MAVLTTLSSTTQQPLASSFTGTSFFDKYVGQALSTIVGSIFNSLGIFDLFGSQGEAVINTSLNTVATQVGSTNLGYNQINYTPFMETVAEESNFVAAKIEDIQREFDAGVANTEDGNLTEAKVKFQAALDKTNEFRGVVGGWWEAADGSAGLFNDIVQTINSTASSIQTNIDNITTFEADTKATALQVAQQTTQQQVESIATSTSTSSTIPSATTVGLDSDILDAIGDLFGDITGLEGDITGLEGDLGSLGQLSKLGLGGLTGISALLTGGVSDLTERVGTLEQPATEDLITARRPELHKAIFERTIPDSPIANTSVGIEPFSFQAPEIPGLQSRLEPQTELVTQRRSALDTAIARLAGDPLTGDRESAFERALSRRAGTGTKRTRPRLRTTTLSGL